MILKFSSVTLTIEPPPEEGVLDVGGVVVVGVEDPPPPPELELLPQPARRAAPATSNVAAESVR
jgi:hypothetical protein